MTDQNPSKNSRWWRGFLDFATESTAVVAERLEKVHLSIADEAFDILEKVPSTRHTSETVREIHHGISRISYQSVAFSARFLNSLVKPKQEPLALPAPDNVKTDDH